jgi:hypothetical protein
LEEKVYSENLLRFWNQLRNMTEEVSGVSVVELEQLGVKVPE